MIENRTHAGKALAEKLGQHTGNSAVVIGLARGGVPIAAAIAFALGIPVDVLVVKKIHSPSDREFGIGAAAPDGITYIDWPTAHRTGADEEYINQAVSLQQSAISQKTRLYRKGKKPYQLRDKIVIIADDGAATGATIEVAIKWLKAKKVKKIIVALPVASMDVASRIKPEVDHLATLETPKAFDSLSEFYKDFSEVTDEEVMRLMN